MRRGFDGLAAMVQQQLGEDPLSGSLFVFRGRKGERIKVLWFSGDGMCLFTKRLESGVFTWPQAVSGELVPKLRTPRLATKRFPRSVGSVACDVPEPAGGGKRVVFLMHYTGATFSFSARQRRSN
ncbi:MAG: transposase [Betaproteobacteria bacterium]|nr:transposase [Betaproteobacteria bacterium]